MGELSLHLRSTFLTGTIADFLKELPSDAAVDDRASKIDDLVKRLQEEMTKIDAFKRELPLCMILLIDAIKALKEESVQLTLQTTEPVLEEFIPLKKCGDENEGSELNQKETDSKDKKNWLSSVQLWNADDRSSNQNLKPHIKKSEKKTLLESEDPLGSCKIRNGGGGRGFMPFKRHGAFPGTIAPRKENKVEFLLSPKIKNHGEEEKSSLASDAAAAALESCRRSISSCVANPQSTFRSMGQQQQAATKQRRCWAPELHRLFVDSLEKLGGPQVATPKQIRELMQVDGLTNDEVKSHLQKYRLHTRKLPSTNGSSHANQSLVLGNIWSPHDDQCGESSRVSNSQSGSPQGPLHLAITSGGTSTTGGDSMEDDIEDEKYESHSWKEPHIHKLDKEGC